MMMTTKTMNDEYVKMMMMIMNDVHIGIDVVLPFFKISFLLRLLMSSLILYDDQDVDVGLVSMS